LVIANFAMLQDMWLKHVVFRVITKVKNPFKSATYKGFFILAEWTGHSAKRQKTQ